MLQCRPPDDELQSNKVSKLLRRATSPHLLATFLGLETRIRRKIMFSRLWWCLLSLKWSHIMSGGGVQKLVCAETRKHTARWQGERFSPMSPILARVAVYERHRWPECLLIGRPYPQTPTKHATRVGARSHWAAVWEG